jgi:hypothetical protein
VDDRGSPVMTLTSSDRDFTEDAYRELLKVARQRYAFRPFAEALETSSGVLWRHDIDISVHRALALARIEREEDVRATYFVHLHSNFYNALETEIVTRLRQIVALGHELGLHFDPQFTGSTPGDSDALARAVSRERDVLQETVDAPVVAVSFHDPDVAGFTQLDDDRIAGLVNAYGSRLRREFVYCSDSNGYWRFKPIGDVLAGPGHDRVQVLTHPEWWVPEPMPPRARIARAIDGRAASAARRYDEALRAHGRETRS